MRSASGSNGSRPARRGSRWWAWSATSRTAASTRRRTRTPTHRCCKRAPARSKASCARSTSCSGRAASPGRSAAAGGVAAESSLAVADLLLSRRAGRVAPSFSSRWWPPSPRSACSSPPSACSISSTSSAAGARSACAGAGPARAHCCGVVAEGLRLASGGRGGAGRLIAVARLLRGLFGVGAAPRAFLAPRPPGAGRAGRLRVPAWRAARSTGGGLPGVNCDEGQAAQATGRGRPARFALSFPAYEDSLGRRVAKVGQGLRLLGMGGDTLGLSVWLPQSAISPSAFRASPPGGLGKAGWVTAAKLEEARRRRRLLRAGSTSYRAVAPKLVAAHIAARTGARSTDARPRREARRRVKPVAR
jgi:hypothetical protein